MLRLAAATMTLSILLSVLVDITTSVDSACRGDDVCTIEMESPQ